MKLTALLVLGAAGFSVLPYSKVRDEAIRGPHPRVEPAGKVSRLRDQSRWVFLTLGGLAWGTAIWGGRTRFGGALTTATLIAGAGATATGLWLAAHDAGAMHFTPRNAAPSVRPSTEGVRPKPAATRREGA